MTTHLTLGSDLDSSAVLAVLMKEEEAAAFRVKIGKAGAMPSASKVVEFLAVVGKDNCLFSA